MPSCLPNDLSSQILPDSARVYRLIEVPGHFDPDAGDKHPKIQAFVPSTDDIDEAVAKNWQSPGLTVWNSAGAEPADARALMKNPKPRVAIEASVGDIHAISDSAGQQVFAVVASPLVGDARAGAGGHCSLFGLPCDSRTLQWRAPELKDKRRELAKVFKDVIWTPPALAPA